MLAVNLTSEQHISTEVQRAVKSVPHFCDSQYVDLDINATFDYFRRKFVDHIFLRLSPDHIVADIGCGYGWLAMALARYTPAKVIAVDLDCARLDAARAIASLLGLEGRIDWRVGSLQHVPLADREADVVFCVEVLEHVQRDVRALDELARVTRRYIVLTTPNGAFPIISHDTCLPFCHWLPMRWRDLYARAFGRLQMQQGNRFWTPFDLSSRFADFDRVSGFLHYRTVDDSLRLYPYYLPYGRGEWRRATPRGLAVYYQLVGRLGRSSQYFLHSLAGTFERRQGHRS